VGRGGCGVVVHVRPITMAEKDEILKSSQTDAYRGVVMSLIVRARDENGNKIFKTAELGELMKKADPEVMSDVVIRMNKAFDEPVTVTNEQEEFDIAKKH